MIEFKGDGVMFKAEAVSKAYQVGDIEADVLRNISFHIDRGEFVSILGLSGCGKTTLLNILAGIERCNIGSIRYEGEELCMFTDDQWTQWRRRHIGYIFQTFNLIDFMTARDNVALAIRLNGTGSELRNKRAMELLALVGLEDKADYLPNQLSGGQKQKVAIARALANNPDILLADEPTGSVDSKTATEIMKMLRDINKQRKVTIIIATHNPKLAELTDHRLSLVDGRIVADELIKHKEEKTAKGTAALVLQQMLGTSVKGKMTFLSAVSLALMNISTKRQRTILTSMGAAIGVMGALLTFGIGFKTRTGILSEEEQMLSNQTMISVTLMLLTGISFIASGIMITLVTHMGIVERTKEIGIMKAIGFSEKDILQVFTSEGGLMGLLAGVLGVVFASIFGMGINIFTRIVYPMIHISLYHVNGLQILFCIILSMGVAIFCANFTAKRASRMDPVESLGYIR